MNQSYRAKRTIEIDGKAYEIFDGTGLPGYERLPYSLRILVENMLRNSPEDTGRVFSFRDDPGKDIPFFPARVLMQDFTGVPCVVDLAAMRDAMNERGGDPGKINPLIPVDLIIDHSVQIDHWGTKDALEKNVAMEYHRNSERYRLLKWASSSMSGFRVIPPNSGICHQINLEYLGSIAKERENNGVMQLIPDSLVGTDSHTTMINGLGIMGWGVGGIEAEAVVLGQPYVMPVPEVIGVRLEGELPRGVTASDLVLTLVEKLRKRGVVEAFVEYYGPGIKSLSLPDRATIANMSPEYGATMGFFPVDEISLKYLEDTGREDEAARAGIYCRETGLFYDETNDPQYSDILVLDLGSVTPSVAGPYRPQDRIELSAVGNAFRSELSQTVKSEAGDSIRELAVNIEGAPLSISDGAIAIASITSCTNTSNPYVMIGAGLIAQKAKALGIEPPPWVKTSLAPGSKVVVDYLERAGLLSSLEDIGFGVSAFGCTTCIGNSGPIVNAISEAAINQNLITASVSSGNRNFEARIHQNVRLNYLMSPMYVVAFALAGTVNIDIQTDVLCTTRDGKDVYLKDIWPGKDDIENKVKEAVYGDDFIKRYKSITEGDKNWRELVIQKNNLFEWDKESSYIKKPDFFDVADIDIPQIKSARILGLFGDSITTDHISPAGTIPGDYPAGQYLQQNGVSPRDFNSYGSRRGNHEVMVRGTFGNIRLQNKLVPEKTGGYTKKFPENETQFIYDAAMTYNDEGTPLVVIAGREYGTGSSRDWAAKGTKMLGVRVVIAESFERIHRSNLAGMGILPVTFKPGENASTLGIKGDEIVDIESIESLTPGASVQFSLKDGKGHAKSFSGILQIFSETEADYIRNGGVLPFILKNI